MVFWSCYLLFSIPTDPQFQGESEINYFRKTNTDLVTFLQTEGWLCLVRIRKVLGMLNNIDNYEQTIDTLSRVRPKKNLP